LKERKKIPEMLLAAVEKKEAEQTGAETED
jgi:hypothetical protein